MPRSAKNKVKAWRRNSLGNHTGRKMKYLSMQQAIGGNGSTAPELLAGMFSRAGISMPKAEAFRDMLKRLIAEKEAKNELVEAVEEKFGGNAGQSEPAVA